MTKADLEKWMELAVDEAKFGQGYVSPNPMVGAVLIRDGKLLAKGFHRAYGEKHAEVECLDFYAGQINGDEILFVTLEPCFHFGKQPPCVDYLINKGIKSVVVGAKDPNPLVAGKSLKKMRALGINVIEGIKSDLCYDLIKPFTKVIRENLPYVILKVAMTMTGQIAPLPLKRTQITAAASRKKLDELRRKVDAIVVGKNTLLIDDPNLGVESANGYKPLRVCWGECELSKIKGYKFLRDSNFRIVPSGSAKSLLENLKAERVNSVLIEGGAKVLQTFLDEGLNERFTFVDEVWVFVSQKCSPFENGLLAFENLPQPLRKLSGWDFEFANLGEDNLLIWRLKR